MKETLKYAMAIGITAAAMFVYMYEAPPRQAITEIASPTSNDKLPNHMSYTSGTPNQEQPSGSKELEVGPDNLILTDAEVFENIKKRLGVSYDPMLVFASAEFTDKEIATYNKYHVLPFNAVVDQVCYEVVEELEFENVIGTQCDRIRERPNPHPYAEIAINELQVLAETDPAAALFMGKRAEKYLESLQWHLRATALSNKTGPLMQFVTSGASGATADLTENNSPQDIVNRRYLKAAIYTLIADLGDPRANPESYISWLESKGYSDNLRGVAQELADNLRREITAIRTEVGIASDA